MNQQQNLKTQEDISDSDVNDAEIDLLGLIQTMGEEKWLLLGLPFFFACIAAVISLYLTPIYSTKATFVLPDKQSSPASAVLDQLGSLGGLAGGLSKSPIEMYLGLMQSNTVQDSIITELELLQLYQTKNLEEARKKLSSQVKITIDKKSGLIIIEAKDQSPEMAARLANAYLKPFRAFLNRMSLEEAHQRRDFFAQQIDAISQRPFRDPFVQSALMNSLIKQYEVARIDEARQSQTLFVVDIASIPVMKSSPKRAQLVILVGIATFFIILLCVFIKRALLSSQKDPAMFQKWVMMKKAWKLNA